MVQHTSDARISFGHAGTHSVQSVSIDPSPYHFQIAAGVADPAMVRRSGMLQTGVLRGVARNAVQKNGAEHCVFGPMLGATVSEEALLLNRTRCLRKNTVGVGADHTDRAHNQHENHS